VLGNLSRDPLHVKGFQCEHVEVRLEEVDERAFLFRVEGRPDTKLAAIVRDDSVLDIPGGLEGADRTLGRDLAWSLVDRTVSSANVTEPPKIILYYHLSRSTWPLSNNK
jgi:hypothetical protein